MYELSPEPAAIETGGASEAARRRPGQAEIEAAVRTLIAAVGDDPAREGLTETPARVARAYREWFSGYRIDPHHLLSRSFGETAGYDETILLRSIPLVSTCEHHLAPIVGVAHVAYRPRDRVVGISKLSRLVDVYARRLQLQERLTRQIAQALNEALQPRGVGVIIEAGHACMSTRGVRQHGVSLVTKCWLGEFGTDAGLRHELLDSLPPAARGSGGGEG
ncbi:GTP cyclohydrolase I FolE [Sphingopyxis panaciterrulae]|uniref:GTP cyclohydrolase 1 n=1 Tax=Sphingopyxis panaciterrulae TaxID=462372 RepID=A0A7W9EQ10_9SPHN|nr:GTP cyclohydrolase I FolE [Sphingopyxis panaciterrulae]MBB5704745.1 GTP cyclohydrolase I [Sphingopyxis panaciterrulae]